MTVVRLHYPSEKWLVGVGSASLLVDKRVTLVFAGTLALLVAAAFLALSLGTTRFGVGELAAALAGGGEDVTRMILFEIRLPRIVATLVAGFALGLAGCISQTLFANRLATPDVLGINEGATLAIVAFVMLASAGSWPFWIAPIGGLVAVAILYKLCTAPQVAGSVLLVVGVCVTEFLRSIVEFLMSMGALHEVQSIYVWLQGSFIGQGYDTSLPVLALIGASLPVQIYLARHLEILRLPPAMAGSLGVHVAALRLVGVVMVAVLAALGAAIGGPVAFVAMAAPILVAALVRNRTPALWCAGLLGAGLLLASDTLARTLAQPEEIAAGVVTRVLGGLFLLYLLIRNGAR